MVVSLGEFSSKEVISVKSGNKLGYIDDIHIDTDDSRVVSLIIKGRQRLFGLLGREDDTIIDWKDVEIFGDDTILVSCSEMVKVHNRKFKRSLFDKIFSN